MILILLLALTVRAGAAAWWQARRPAGQPFALADSVSYWHLAGCVARGEPYAYPDEKARVFRAPVYPLVLAPLFLLWGGEPPVLAARLQAALWGTLAVGAVMWLASTLWDRRAAWWAGLAAALYPGGVATSILVLSEAIFCPLMIGQFCCWSAAATGRPGRMGWWSLTAGFLAAAATLARPSWLLFTPGALCLLVLDRRWRNRRGFYLAIATLLGLCLGMLPWWIRSYRLSGHFVLTTLQVGASLYDGLNPEATGGSDMQFTRQFFQQLEAEYASDHPPHETFEYEIDQRMKRAALAWARANPGRVVELVGIKLVRMWRPWPNADEFGSWPIRVGVAAAFLPLFAASVVGAVRFFSRGWLVWILVLPAFYFTLLHVIFVSSIRYRQPAMLLLTALAGAACAAWQARPRSKADGVTSSAPGGEAV